MDEPRWNDDDLRESLGRYGELLNDSSLTPTTFYSYVDYASQFLRWRTGDYQPRGVPLRGRVVPVGPVALQGLRDELSQYETALREAGLRPKAVHTYVDSASRFVRWLAGEYTVPAPGGGARPPRPPAPPATSDEGAGDGDDRPWYWECRVHDLLVAHLISRGWQILSMSDAERRERGVDVLARLEHRTLAIEVEGYPNPTRERGLRRGDREAADPAAQAMHYIGDALFTVTRWRDVFPERESAIALPDVPRYRDLIAQRRTALQRLGVGVFLIAEDGLVSEVIKPVE